MTHNTARTFAIALWWFGGAACGTHSLSSSYRPMEAAAHAELIVDTLVVEIGPDQRPLLGGNRLGPGFLAWIPLFPYGHQMISPDRWVVDDLDNGGDFRDDVAKTVVSDLRAERVASTVRLAVTSPDRPSEPIPTLRVTLKEGIFQRYLTAYGLSVAGVFLYVVGFPTTYGSVDIDLAVELRDAKGRALGQQTFSGSASAIEWLYRPVGPAYTSALPDAYAQISPGLRAFVREHLQVSAATASRE